MTHGELDLFVRCVHYLRPSCQSRHNLVLHLLSSSIQFWDWLWKWSQSNMIIQLLQNREKWNWWHNRKWIQVTVLCICSLTYCQTHRSRATRCLFSAPLLTHWSSLQDGTEEAMEHEQEFSWYSDDLMLFAQYQLTTTDVFTLSPRGRSNLHLKFSQTQSKRT